MSLRQQCHADCWNGRRCTLQLSRRWRPSIVWSVLVWFGIERRNSERRAGFDRRARVAGMHTT